MTISISTTQAEIMEDLGRDIFKVKMQFRAGALTFMQYMNKREKIEKQIDRLLQI